MKRKRLDHFKEKVGPFVAFQLFSCFANMYLVHTWETINLSQMGNNNYGTVKIHQMWHQQRKPN